MYESMWSECLVLSGGLCLADYVERLHMRYGWPIGQITANYGILISLISIIYVIIILFIKYSFKIAIICIIGSIIIYALPWSVILKAKVQIFSYIAIIIGLIGSLESF